MPSAPQRANSTVFAIQCCHQQIAEQCERLSQQVRNGKQTYESRHVLLCLCQSLHALERARVAMSSDGKRVIDPCNDVPTSNAAQVSASRALVVSRSHGNGGA